MRIDLPIRRRRPLSLTSLIDIIFLLLLFFMLSSTFTRFAKVEISAGAASAHAAVQAPDILIRLASDRWQINGLPFTHEEALPELKRLQDAGAAKAVLVVRDGVTSQALVSALERIRDGTGLSVTVAR
jgi:biopolymer transport protein ExbD